MIEIVFFAVPVTKMGVKPTVCGQVVCFEVPKVPLFGEIIFYVQSTLVILTSVISNNRLSRRKNLVLVITKKSKTSYKILWKRGEIAPGEQFLPFSTIFSIYISI